MIEFILVWCILPSLICFLLFIQIRHMEPKETLTEFFKNIASNDVEFIYLTIILWPIFVVTILLFFILLVIGYIIDKYNLPTINLSWLFTELKEKQNGRLNNE